MNKPLISFVCPSYNHEKYIDSFISSVLKQGIRDWELIIIDDYSTDNNVLEINRFNDKRIKLIKNSFNRGIAFGLNQGINHASSDIISFIASDDILYPNYIETVLAELKDQSISVVYTPLQHMDEAGILIPNITSLPYQQTTKQIFIDLFLLDNQLPSPGMAFRKSAFTKSPQLNLGMIQYSDWQLHLFLLINSNIKLLSKPIIQYRTSNISACSRSNATIARETIETEPLMNTVVDLIGHDVTTFNKFFGDHPVLNGKLATEDTIDFWLGRLALTSPLIEKQKWGLRTVMNCIAIPGKMELLNRLYGFSFKEYMKWGDLNTSPPILSKKITKYKRMSYLLLVLLIAMALFNAFLYYQT